MIIEGGLGNILAVGGKGSYFKEKVSEFDIFEAAIWLLEKMTRKRKRTERGINRYV